ncbi:SDR family NAD(P)-dependent oxidoreductase [Actinospongicola halichondriae]|uniref:SDR family NAD(P)-dependent oxidoreductase n=1 Tax=Actinospongicola halichondriae TaxID=3236844 RepID=UPI003D5ACDF9
MTSLLVTGGAAGIGAAIASEGVRRGWRVGVIDREASDVDGVTSFRADVTDAAAVVDVVDEFGAPDITVNNAGLVRFGPLVDLSVDDWRSVVDVNLTGTFLVARTVARAVQAAGSTAAIVNISSMNGIVPGPKSGAYGSTKAAIGLLTQQMALEWAPDIRVNAVAPGLIDAGMSAPIYADAEARRAREGRVPLGRLGTERDIVDATLWLASDEARYVTGQTLLVDGGVTMSMLTTLPRPAAVEEPT